jgi:hypothetical protein
MWWAIAATTCEQILGDKDLLGYAITPLFQT